MEDTPIKPRLLAAEAFAMYARPDSSGCVLWHGYRDGGGYGRIGVGNRYVLAHRYAWEQVNGPIPAGAFMDHVCHTRECVNVDHLRLATRNENGANRAGALSTRTTDLPRNVYRRKNGRYQVQLRVAGSIRTFGTHDTVEQASNAARRARELEFGEFAGNG